MLEWVGSVKIFGSVERGVVGLAKFSVGVGKIGDHLYWSSGGLVKISSRVRALVKLSVGLGRISQTFWLSRFFCQTLCGKWQQDWSSFLEE